MDLTLAPIDVGASQLIADGKIKLKSGYDIECFTKTGVKLKDGTELPADVVVFATGYVLLLNYVMFLLSVPPESPFLLRSSSHECC